MSVGSFDPEKAGNPAIPEPPFWVRPWGTLWRWKPQCCGFTLKSKSNYEAHWLREHDVVVVPPCKESH